LDVSSSTRKSNSFTSISGILAPPSVGSRSVGSPSGQ
jgi:hypothetical protein